VANLPRSETHKEEVESAAPAHGHTEDVEDRLAEDTFTMQQLTNNNILLKYGNK